MLPAATSHVPRECQRQSRVTRVRSALPAGCTPPCPVPRRCTGAWRVAARCASGGGYSTLEPLTFQLCLRVPCPVHKTRETCLQIRTYRSTKLQIQYVGKCGGWSRAPARRPSNTVNPARPEAYCPKPARRRASKALPHPHPTPARAAARLVDVARLSTRSPRLPSGPRCCDSCCTDGPETARRCHRRGEAQAARRLAGRRTETPTLTSTLASLPRGHTRVRPETRSRAV